MAHLDNSKTGLFNWPQIAGVQMHATYGKLLAWIDDVTPGDDAAFVGEGATSRLPAMHLCSTPDDAREWFLGQADAFDLPVRWVDR